MPRNATGTATNPIASFSASALIKSADFNSINTDIYTELTNSIDKGGRTTPTANLPMGGFKFTGLAAGSAAGDSARYDELILKANIAAPSFTGGITVTGGIAQAEGANAKQGVAVLVGGTVTVSNTSVTANSRIFLCSNVDGGTPGWLRVSAKTAATSFVITSSSGTDTSTVAWVILEG